ncbi:MAG TPA: DNA-binding protein [Candidatus Omnitrophica bacterium]|nr:DNA-binding protein [Candidatus Omnitrophota bacterium]
MKAAIETFTPNDLAKILNLHPFTVTRLAREGTIPAFKVGGVWRFRKDEFERWIQQRTKRSLRRTGRQQLATAKSLVANDSGA